MLETGKSSASVFKNVRKSQNSYRSPSVFPATSKVLERIVFNQPSAFLAVFFQSFNVVSVKTDNDAW